MRFLLISLLFTLSLHTYFTKQTTGKTYYVSLNGNDSNNGTSKHKAFRSVEKVNSLQLFPGDRVLFESGGVWAGSTGLRPKGNGSKENSIILGSYGKGPKPVINVTAGNENGLTLEGQSHWVIKGIEFRSVNHNGIAINGVKNRKIENIHIEQVNAINCSPQFGQREFDHCGIRVGGHGKEYALPVGAWLENIEVDRCTVDNCAVGIMIAGRIFDETRLVTPEDSISKNCHIKNCSASNISGDGIVIFCAADVSIEHCSCYNACRYNADKRATAGIWTWNVRNAIVRFCESFGHLTPGTDRNPFDSDYESFNSIYEYNYGHDCYGAAILMCAPRSSNDMAVFRYNVFKNCGLGSSLESAFIKFYDCETSQRRYIYNNTFVGAPDYFVTSLKSKAYVYIFNNIFYHTEKLNYASELPIQGCYTDVLLKNMHGNNLFCNITGVPDAQGNIYSDPAFVDINKTGTGFCDGLKIRKGSPAIDKGLDLTHLNIGLESMGNRDYWGNKLPVGKGFDIGAFEQ